MSLRRACRGAAAALVAAVAALLMAQPAYAIDTTFKYEMNPQHNSDKCIGTSGGSTADGAHMRQFVCDGRANQRFTFEPLGGNAYKIHPTHSNKCLAVENRSTANLAHIIQTTCANDTAQQWRILNDKLQPGLSGAQIASVLSGRCLDVEGASNAVGARLVQFDCGQQLNQKFDLLAFA
jgi:Ricin-type beta-trefoil lectin domain-like